MDRDGESFIIIFWISWNCGIKGTILLWRERFVINNNNIIITITTTTTTTTNTGRQIFEIHARLVYIASSKASQGNIVKPCLKRRKQTGKTYQLFLGSYIVKISVCFLCSWEVLSFFFFF